MITHTISNSILYLDHFLQAFASRYCAELLQGTTPSGYIEETEISGPKGKPIIAGPSWSFSTDRPLL